MAADARSSPGCRYTDRFVPRCCVETQVDSDLLGTDKSDTGYQITLHARPPSIHPPALSQSPQILVGLVQAKTLLTRFRELNRTAAINPTVILQRILLYRLRDR